MIKPIVHDEKFLAIPSTACTKMDLNIAKDLQDTLKAHENECVGLAANMIGYSKRMIVIQFGMIPVVMINPVITQKKDAYETKEGCLSLEGERKTKRYKRITVEYQDVNFRKVKQKYSGFVAQIIQHEVDHCDGIII